jgi:hypothetical protein
MFHDFSSRAVSCSEEIASFNTLYMKSQHIFEHAAASRAQNPAGIRRLRPNEMFLPQEQVESSGGGSEGAKAEDTEMKDFEDEGEGEVVFENTKDEEIDDVVEEFSGRLMHRDVEVEELPGGTPAKRTIKVCGALTAMRYVLTLRRLCSHLLHHCYLQSRLRLPSITPAPSLSPPSKMRKIQTPPRIIFTLVYCEPLRRVNGQGIWKCCWRCWGHTKIYFRRNATNARGSLQGARSNCLW